MLIPAGRWLPRFCPGLPIAAALVAASVGPAAPRAPAADCNGNGVDDFAEVTGGTAPDCNGNGVPDPCELLAANHGYQVRSGIQAGSTSSALLAQDLDGDGHRDIAALHAEVTAVLVAWNDARRGFLEPFTFGTESIHNGALAAGDVNGDGLTDIAVGGFTGTGILFQGRPRNFVFHSIPVGTESSSGSLALADLDLDGRLDVAFAGGFEVLVLLGKGTTAFGEARSFPAGSGPVHLVAADLDGDGDEDIATANFLQGNSTGSVSIFLNRGSGDLAAPRNFAVGEIPASLAAGDLDGDGSLDLVTANPGSSEISILLGRGDGTFAGAIRLHAPSAPSFAALGDLDGDGDLDVAVSMVKGVRDASSGGAISLFWNHGSGVLRHAGDFPVGSILSSIAIGDLLGDGVPEIVAADAARSEIHVAEGALVAYGKDCDGNGIPDDCDLGRGDCNGNGVPDVCDIASRQSGDCDRNGIPDECEPDCNGNGVADDCDVSTSASEDCNRNGIPDECDVTPGELGFDAFFLEGSGPGFAWMDARDVDGDGRPDLVVLEPTGNVNVLWNAGNLAFEPVTAAVGDLPRGSLVTPGDLDGDGDLDIVLGSPGSQALDLMLLSGRAFAEAPALPLGEDIMGLCAADFDGDGLTDVAAAGLSGDLHISPGKADGALGPARRFPAGLGPNPLEAADVDRDGAIDIACILGSGSPAVLWNEGGASFTGPATLPTPLELRAVLTFDPDGDGDRDVAASGTDGFLVFRQAARRAFEPGAEVGSRNVSALVAADLDRDGLEDLAAAHDGSGTQGIDLHRSWGDGAFDPASAIPVLPGSGFGTLAAADLDGDGWTDLVAGFKTARASFRAFILRSNARAPVSRDRNRNGRPDECDPGAFRRGDADGDGALDLTDAVFTLRALFQGGPAPGCAEAADADNDGSVSITDPVSVLDFLFRGGPPPAAPGPPPGPCGLGADAPGSPAHLGCAAYEGC